MPDRPDDDPETPAEFEAALASLLANAADNGVEVVGGWECEPVAGRPAWDVHVTEVRRD
jgi:hypothetical protein